MSNYSVTTNFGAKDTLISGNPAKLILGAQLTTEFNNIATAVGTKYDPTSILSLPGGISMAAGAGISTLTLAATPNFVALNIVGAVNTPSGVVVSNTSTGANAISLFEAGDGTNVLTMGCAGVNAIPQVAGSSGGLAAAIYTNNSFPLLLGSAGTLVMTLSAGMQISGASGATPVGGDKGVGTINIPAAYYVAGVKQPIFSAPVSGWGTPTGASVVNNFSGSAATLAQATAVIAELITILKTAGILST